MAVSMNLRDLINPQYSAVTGRKLKTPYAAYLTAMGPYTRAAAVQAQQDALRDKELLQGQTNFNASQTLEREKLGAAESQAGKANTISGVNTAITAASLANQAGIINLKDIASGAGGVVKDAGAMYAGEAGGVGLTEVGSLAGGEAAGTVSAEQAAAAMYASDAGGVGGTAAGSVGGSGASLSGIAAPALAYGIAGHYAMQEAGSAQKKLFGGNESNTGVKLGDVVGRASEGAIGPLVDTFWKDAPGAVRVATDIFNPAGFLARTFDRGRCIIVTACTFSDSEEVNIAREFRDKFLSPEQLRGYYMIAEKAVPLINRYPIVKWFVKRILVDNLIKYGRHSLRERWIDGYTYPKGPYPGPVATLITRGFLVLCKTIGNRKTSFVRCNGEIV